MNAPDTSMMGAARTTDELEILIIEDDDVFVEFARVVMDRAGFEHCRAVVVATWADAEHALTTQHIDLVLADLSLPDSTGLDVVRRCRAVAREVPVVVLTACRDAALASEALSEGAQDYLVKGEFDEHDLHRSIRYAMARARAEAALCHTLDELERSNRQLEEYATIASHDLRSPVRTARVLTGRLFASPAVQADPDARRLGDALNVCLGRLEAMLEGLLDYAQAGDVSSGEPVAVSIRALAAEVVNDLDADLRTAGADVRIVGDASMRAHPVLARSLLANLVQNAVKYRSVRPLRITITASDLPGRLALVRVIDNGIGIEPAFRSRVFTMFERLSANGDGIGLGLALCHRIVSLHGGRIWIDDGDDGTGTAVCFAVPAAP